jgi:hypothetical protein
MKKKLMVLSGLVLSFSPVVAFAAVNGCRSGSSNGILFIVCAIGDILNVLVPILIVLAVIYFIWGVIKYVVSGDEEDKAKGRSMIIYGLIGLVVIVGMWGIVNMLIGTLGVTGNSVTTPQLPQ